MGGATAPIGLRPITLIFQSTLPVGGATASQRPGWFWPLISIHAPRGGSDKSVSEFVARLFYFNPRSPWGERPLDSTISCPKIPISIHAPRGGSDLTWVHWKEFMGISIHAPRGGSDSRPRGPQRRRRNFNPRSPWGERQSETYKTIEDKKFQSTLPVGGATRPKLRVAASPLFQSTLPVGGATSFVFFFAENMEFQSTLPVGGATGKKHD